MRFFSDLKRRLGSLDYRDILSFQLEIRPTLRAIPYWVAAVAVGFAAVIYSGMFGAVITFSQSLAQSQPYLLLALGPTTFVLGSWLVARLAPPAGGTGVPQVVSTIQMDFVSSSQLIYQSLNLRVALVIVGSSLLCVMGGGALGREGPMVHIAACIFYFVARQFSAIWPYQEHRSWIIAGGAAGVAAAFNTPLAGIVFVLEELAQQHFHQFKTVVISAVIVAGMIAQWLSGRYLFLGYPRIDGVPFVTVFYSIAVGAACGIGAGLFERIRLFLTARLAPLFARYRLAVAGVLGFLVACIAVFVDHRAVGGGISAIQELLFTGESASWNLVLGRFFSTILSSLSGCAGGFLAPALSLGAAVGSKMAWWLSPTDHNLLVMVGMAGFLSAVTRAPFTALVIVMEMTDRHSTIFPLMIGSLVGLGVMRLAVGRRQ